MMDQIYREPVFVTYFFSGQKIILFTDFTTKKTKPSVSNSIPLPQREED